MAACKELTRVENVKAEAGRIDRVKLPGRSGKNRMAQRAGKVWTMGVTVVAAFAAYGIILALSGQGWEKILFPAWVGVGMMWTGIAIM